MIAHLGIPKFQVYTVSFSDFKRTENDRVGLLTDLNIHLVALFDPRMTSMHLQTENFEQPAHWRRITSSSTSIVPATSRNSDVSVQVRRLIEVFAAYALRLFSCDMVHHRT